MLVSPWDGFAIDPRDATPLHAQLERGILAAIAAGRLRRGDQLPTVGSWRSTSGSTRTPSPRSTPTSSAHGMLETRRGVGTFVAPRGTTSRPTRGARQSELRRLVDRFLADLSSHGFSVDDALPEIEGRRQQGA